MGLEDRAKYSINVEVKVFECVLSFLILVFFSTALANFLKTDPNLTFLAENVINLNIIIIGLLLLIAYLTIYVICYYNYEEEIRAWQKKRKRRR